MFGTKIANEKGEGMVMNLFAALYKVLVWMARSVVLIVVVLFLGVLLRFSGKR